MDTQTSNRENPRSAAARRGFVGLAAAILAAAGAAADAQDFETTNWADVDRFDSRDPDSPYFVEPNEAITWAGSVTSQADPVMNAATGRANFGVDGSGIKIGVISDSYNTLGGEAAGVASGDLPGLGNSNGFVTPVTVVKDDVVGIDEGRAMIELIHDLAPGAEILFHSAFNSPGPVGSAPSTTIANAIDALRQAGADIIVDDVAILTAAKYQDGAAAQAVDRAFAAGIPYFSSAGNNSNNAYEANHASSVAATGFNDLHNFNATGDFDQILDLGFLQPGEEFRATLKWADPYTSLGTATTTDLSLLFVLNNESEGLNNAVVEANENQDAFEFGGITNPFNTPLEVGIAVDRVSGDPAELLSIEVIGRDIVDDNDTDSPTIHGHNAARGGLAVAAQFYNDPGLDDVEPFSAAGPTLILFDADGNPLDTPEVRATPQITGIDGTDTTFFSGFDVEPNGFPNFFGTSAAAPHVAAVSALLLERAAELGLSLSPSELYEHLFASTIDIESPGFDTLSGFGRLDAQLALSQLVPEPGSFALLLVGLAMAGRTRRHR